MISQKSWDQMTQSTVSFSFLPDEAYWVPLDIFFPYYRRLKSYLLVAVYHSLKYATNQGIVFTEISWVAYVCTNTDITVTSLWNMKFMKFMIMMVDRYQAPAESYNWKFQNVTNETSWTWLSIIELVSITTCFGNKSGNIKRPPNFCNITFLNSQFITDRSTTCILETPKWELSCL